jgi:predicted nucleic acid-binding protein
MITFVDTNVLLDIFLPDPKWGNKSKMSLQQAFKQGSLIINEIIYSELSPQFSSKTLLDSTLKTLSIRIVSTDLESAYHAGQIWKEYRKSGGKRSRILADFLIGAHAEIHAEQLLTRDRGFYKKYFSNLLITYQTN